MIRILLLSYTLTSPQTQCDSFWKLKFEKRGLFFFFDKPEMICGGDNGDPRWAFNRVV